ncbi:MAG: L,D-transpeptidase [Thermoleophilaceae bacterium]
MASKSGLTLRARPNGRVVAHLEPQTDYGSPTVVWAARRRGDWLGVIATALPNNRVGWLDVQHDRPRMWRSRYTITADLSSRIVSLRRGTKVVRTLPVTVGAPSTPTPVGRFEVTDKLVPRAGSGYGCCIVALSGHQKFLRPGWAGGDRIAIHGSPSQAVKTAASAGCLRARDSDLRALMRTVPLGTPVVIRA